RSRTLPAGFIAPCLPTNAHSRLPALCLHEIKHDGFRVIARKEEVTSPSLGALKQALRHGLTCGSPSSLSGCCCCCCCCWTTGRMSWSAVACSSARARQLSPGC